MSIFLEMRCHFSFFEVVHFLTDARKTATKHFSIDIVNKLNSLKKTVTQMPPSRNSLPADSPFIEFPFLKNFTGITTTSN